MVEDTPFSGLGATDPDNSVLSVTIKSKADEPPRWEVTHDARSSLHNRKQRIGKLQGVDFLRPDSAGSANTRNLLGKIRRSADRGEGSLYHSEGVESPCRSAQWYLDHTTTSDDHRRS